MKEFKTGDEVLVSTDGKHWYERVYLYTHPHTDTYICIHPDSEKAWTQTHHIEAISWLHIKPNDKPKIEITVKINGKTAKLSDISNETLAKLKESE